MNYKDKDKEKAYREYVLNAYRKSNINASIVIILAFGIFIYADKYIFNYPSIITNMRVLTITCFCLYIGASLKESRASEKVRIWLYVISNQAALAFALIVSFNTRSRGVNTSNRDIQVIMAIMIGIVLFGGSIRNYIGRMIGVSMAAFLLCIVILRGPSIQIFFEYFNVIFFAVAVVLFNRKLNRSSYEEFITKLELREKVKQLEDQILARKLAEKELHNMAHYDSLTHFYNRGAGIKAFEKLFESATKKRSFDFSICFVDLDNLKYINDTYGHKMGDSYILDFAEGVRHCIRSSDICIRLGGDEFLLVFPEASFEKVEDIWSRILREIESIPLKADKPYLVAASHGVIEFREGKYSGYSEMLEKADELMYKEKTERKKKSSESSSKIEI